MTEQVSNEQKIPKCLEDYRQTPKQKSVDICIYGIMNFIYGANKIEMVKNKLDKCNRRAEKFQEILDSKSKIRSFFSKDYRLYMIDVEDRIDFWLNEAEECDEVGEELFELNKDNIRYLPKIAEIQAEIKRHPDFSPIFYGDHY